MRFLATILLCPLAAVAVQAGLGHRVAVGSGTVGVKPVPVVIFLKVVYPSPFTNCLFDIVVVLPSNLDTNLTYQLQGSTNLIDWYRKSYTTGGDKFGLTKRVAPHEFYRLVGK